MSPPTCACGCLEPEWSGPWRLMDGRRYHSQDGALVITHYRRWMRATVSGDPVLGPIIEEPK